MLLVLALALTLVPTEVADLLTEPEYIVSRDGEGWAVRKPSTGRWQPVTISRHAERSAAEMRRRSLPRLRLPVLLVRFDPATSSRTIITDWSGEKDARQAEQDLQDILKRFAPAGKLALLESTPVYMAHLFEASGHTAEQGADFERFAIYIDPFRATGRLHAAATLLHELTHLETYRARGFHANRAAAVLSRKDFVLLGLADELEACRAEANLIRSFVDSQKPAQVRDAVRAVFRDPALRWPPALTLLAGFEGPPDDEGRLAAARRNVVLDVEAQAGKYWDAHHGDLIDPLLSGRIRRWQDSAEEWKQIKTERKDWQRAELPTRRSGR